MIFHACNISGGCSVRAEAYRCQVEIVEYITAGFPYCCASVLLLALVLEMKVMHTWLVNIDKLTIESIYLRNLSAFVVSPE